MPNFVFSRRWGGCREGGQLRLVWVPRPFDLCFTAVPGEDISVGSCRRLISAVLTQAQLADSTLWDFCKKSCQDPVRYIAGDASTLVISRVSLSLLTFYTEREFVWCLVWWLIWNKKKMWYERRYPSYVPAALLSYLAHRQIGFHSLVFSLSEERTRLLSEPAHERPVWLTKVLCWLRSRFILPLLEQIDWTRILLYFGGAQNLCRQSCNWDRWKAR